MSHEPSHPTEEPLRLRITAALEAALFWSVLMGVVYTLKRLASDANAVELAWILRPTVWLVSFLGGAQFEDQGPAGFFDAADRFLVAPVCAGVNFMIAALITLTVGLRRRIPELHLGVIALSLVGAYVLALGCNAGRILLAMKLHVAHTAVPGLNDDSVHRLLGVAVYVLALGAVSVALARGGARHAQH